MKKRGSGISLVYYPVGMSGGGDTTQAIIKIKPDGGVDLYIGSCDLGQGIKTIAAQIVAEELGISMDEVVIHNEDTDVAGICTGSFASRVTYFAGNAIKRAAEDARKQMFELATEDLGVEFDAMSVSDGKIFVTVNPEKFIKISDFANKINFGLGKIIVGKGYFWKEPACYTDVDKGQINAINTLAYGASLANVEVDTDTGEVRVLKMINVFDAGKAINPMGVLGQIDGGVMMGLSSTLMEDLLPNYPNIEMQPKTLGEYITPTSMDKPELISLIYENPSTHGPYGAKGLGEMTNNTAAPAIVNAIHDAVGIWIDKIPVTPEKVLKALEELGKN
ncbi:MAG: hypothetical protein APF76_16785 [Desulfitibacter sp. BRH_c19]|nr:MAG: hypothetical protein APF76_16785 [Desulfitibacter sp. BRH_c19]